jgi:hypothetical protein
MITLDYSMYWYWHWFWLRIFPFYLTGLTNFGYGLFRLPNLNTLILTTDNWSRAHGGCDRSAEDAYSSMAPDPAPAFVGGPCCPTLGFVIVLWIMLTFHTLLSSNFVFQVSDRIVQVFYFWILNDMERLFLSVKLLNGIICIKVKEKYRW